MKIMEEKNLSKIWKRKNNERKIKIEKERNKCSLKWKNSLKGNKYSLREKYKKRNKKIKIE
jgi:hypothetical protein